MELQILLYSNRKIDPVAWDATGDKEPAAFLALFQHLKDDWQVYEASPLTKPQRVLYEKALAGDGAAAKKLLTSRRDYEYECWTLLDAIDPAPNASVTQSVQSA